MKMAGDVNLECIMQALKMAIKRINLHNQIAPHSIFVKKKMSTNVNYISTE